MREEVKYQYWIKSITGIGNKKLKKIVEYCGSAREAYRLTQTQLAGIYGISARDAENITESKRNRDLEKEAETLEKKGISMITIEEAEFPERLRQIADCPYAVFYRGKLPEEKEKTAAVVGARMCSGYGRAVALELGKKLAACGVSVISGMAVGIDSFGHWGAIKGNGKTYAVLGCGADVCYPKGAGELYERILNTGGIISEYLPGEQPLPYRFPERNRIISGLADFLIVVEAKEKSGSLITADSALDQGKEIYAVPGRIDDALSAGCNWLIKQGAGILLSAEDMLLEQNLISQRTDSQKEKEKNLLEKEELLVYSCFGLDVKNIEELTKLTGLEIEKTADILVRLQAKGMIEESFKNQYRKKD